MSLVTDSLPCPKHAREAERLAALRSYDILDSLPEQPFDDIALLAGHVCNAPIALISFVDDDRQWFKAKVGTGLCGTPRSIAICNDVVLAGKTVVIEDLADDPRVKGSTLAQTGLRFYAGAPIMSPDGLPLGTVCVLDVSPRDLDDRERLLLEALARQVELLLEARLHANIVRERDVKLQLLEALVHGTSEAMMLVGKDGHILETNDAASKLYGYTSAQFLAQKFQGLDTAERMIPSVAKTRYETAHRSAAGKLLPVEVSASAIVDGEAFAVVIRSLKAEIEYRPTVPAPSGIMAAVKAA